MAEENKNVKDAVDNGESVKKTDKKSASKPKDKKPNKFVVGCKKFGKFMKDTVGELKKVVWLSKGDVWKSFKLVIATVVGVSIIIGVIDLTSSFLIESLAGLIG